MDKPTQLRRFVEQLSEVIIPADVLNAQWLKISLVAEEPEKLIIIDDFIYKEGTASPDVVFSPEFKEALLEAGKLSQFEKIFTDNVLKLEIFPNEDYVRLYMVLYLGELGEYPIFHSEIFYSQYGTILYLHELWDFIIKLDKDKLEFLLPQIFARLPEPMVQIYALLLGSNLIHQRALEYGVPENRWKLLIKAFKQARSHQPQTLSTITLNTSL